jgi:hypothetical protein
LKAASGSLNLAGEMRGELRGSMTGVLAFESRGVVMGVAIGPKTGEGVGEPLGVTTGFMTGDWTNERVGDLGGESSRAVMLFRIFCFGLCWVMLYVECWRKELQIFEGPESFIVACLRTYRWQQLFAYGENFSSVTALGSAGSERKVKGVCGAKVKCRTVNHRRGFGQLLPIADICK